MQTITLPSSMPAEMVRQTVLDTAWNLIKNNQLGTESFVEMIALNAATNGGPTLYQTVIRLAFQDEAFELIQNLIASGLAQYPDDGWLQRAKRVMAPPKEIGTSPSRPNFAAAWAWVREHSLEYHNQWVALRGAELIGTADSYDSLVTTLGEAANRDDIEIALV